MKNIWNKIPKWVRVWGIVILSAYIAFNLICPSGTWRYKVTVNIDTPEGIKTGSAVREFSNCACWIDLLPLPDAGNPPDDFKGEAVVIDLGERGVVFAVMGTDDYRTYYTAFPIKGASTPSGILKYNFMDDKKVTLNPTQYPLMVTFTDIKDPKTVTPVYRVVGTTVPSSPNYTYDVEDKFEELFGAGVTLKDITIETTNERVTWQVEKQLPWIPFYYNRMLDGLTHNTIKSEYPLANSLASGAFSTGEKK